MSTFFRLAAISLLGLIAAPVAAQEVQVATISAPEAHSVVLENEHVRVISALASAGHKSPMHSHPPLVVISLGTARVKLTSDDGSEQIVNFRPGTVIWGEGGVHEWELLAGEVNVIAVEVKSANPANAGGGE